MWNLKNPYMALSRQTCFMEESHIKIAGADICYYPIQLVCC